MVIQNYFGALFSTMIKEVNPSKKTIDDIIIFHENPDENPVLAMFADLEIEKIDKLDNITKTNFLEFSTAEKINFMYNFILLEGKRLAKKIKAIPSLAENIRTETEILNDLEKIEDIKLKFTEFNKRLEALYNARLISSASSSSSSSSSTTCIEHFNNISDWKNFMALLRPHYHRGFTIFKDEGNCSSLGHTATLSENTPMTDEEIRIKLDNYYNKHENYDVPFMAFDKSDIQIPIAVGAHGPFKSSASSSGSKYDVGVTYEDAAAWMQYKGGKIAVFRPMKTKYVIHLTWKTIAKFNFFTIPFYRFIWSKRKFVFYKLIKITIPIKIPIYSVSTDTTLIPTSAITDKAISQIKKPYCSAIGALKSKLIAPKSFICSSLNWYTIKKTPPNKLNISAWYTCTILPYQVAKSRKMELVGVVKP